MRAFGSPPASMVASVIAVGSRGSEAVASVSQAENSRNGSSAWVKSPVVNQLGCSIGAVSDIFRSTRLAGVKTHNSGCAPARLWRALPLAAGLTLALTVGGCSINTGQFDSLFGGSDKSDTTGSI